MNVFEWMRALMRVAQFDHRGSMSAINQDLFDVSFRIMASGVGRPSGMCISGHSA